MGSIAYALAAGNAVVFKPSEYTPGVGKWLVEAFAEVVPEQPVLQLITGLRRDGRRAVPVGCGQDRVHRFGARPGKDHGRVRGDADPGGDRGGRQGLAAGRRGRRPRRGGRRGGLGRHVQRGPDLHRRRAGVRAREGARRVRGEGGREGRRTCAPARTTRRQVSARSRCPSQLERDPEAHRGRAGPRRQGGASAARTRSATGSCSRRCWWTSRRTRGGHRGDVRPDADDRQGPRHGRGGREARTTPSYGLGNTVFSKSRGMELAKQAAVRHGRRSTR